MTRREKDMQRIEAWEARGKAAKSRTEAERAISRLEQIALRADEDALTYYALQAAGAVQSAARDRGFDAQ